MDECSNKTTENKEEEKRENCTRDLTIVQHILIIW